MLVTNSIVVVVFSLLYSMAILYVFCALLLLQKKLPLVYSYLLLFALGIFPVCCYKFLLVLLVPRPVIIIFSQKQNKNLPLQWLIMRCSHTLRSANQHQLIVPRCRRITFGRWAFSVAGPTVWNSLPAEFRSLSVSFGDFRRTLETILFARY